MKPGGTLPALRNTCGLSQRELGHIAGCSTSHLCQVERGTRRMSAEKLQRIISHFRLSAPIREMVREEYGPRK